MKYEVWLPEWLSEGPCEYAPFGTYVSRLIYGNLLMNALTYIRDFTS